MSIGQTNLREPDQVDWASIGSGSTYNPPPPALDDAGNPITYYAKVASIEESDGKGLDQGFLNYQIDLKLVQTPGGRYDGQSIRTWASNRTFQKRQDDGTFINVKGNPNALAKFLKASGLSAKPQTNADYRAAVKAVNGKAIPVTLEWEAKNRESGEMVKGYTNFPLDPDRPGQRKSILKAGDVLADGSTVIQSEVLFANPRIKYFQVPSGKPVGR